MKKPTFFRILILLGVVALGLHLTARDEIMNNMNHKAEAISTAVSHHVKYEPDAESIRLSQSLDTLNNIGLVFTFLCLNCIVVALVRREPGFYSIPVLLLFFDIMTQILLI
jgi:hypothetical protein